MVILRGNDITLRWTITKCLDGSEVPEDFSGADLSVFILSFYDRVRFNALVEGNVITVSIPGNTQKNGKIGLEAVWSKNSGKNWSRAKQVDVLEISDDPKRVTHCSGATVDNHVVELANKLVGSVGYDGITPEIINGNWWIGSVDTGISATGPQGDAFTFEDFTSEQIDMLKQPAVDAAKEVAKLESTISLNEQVRIQAEQNRAQAEEDRSLSEQGRVDNESIRVSNEESRTQSETIRHEAEIDRASTEQLRVQGEEKRIAEEQKRVSAEQSRETAEHSRVTASDKAVKECKAAATNATEQGDYAKTQGDVAKTAAEKAIDAKMDLFIDMWNARCSQLGNCGKYNASTKLFELNGILDISYQEAMRIWSESAFTTVGYDFSVKFAFTSNIRTVFPLKTGHDSVACALSRAFQNSSVEVVKFQNGIRVKDGEIVFYSSKISKIIGTLNMDLSPSDGMFSKANYLTDCSVYKLKKSYSFSDCSALSNYSILYMVTNAVNTTQITITLHRDAYARATADSAIVAKALEKNIILASA